MTMIVFYFRDRSPIELDPEPSEFPRKSILSQDRLARLRSLGHTLVNNVFP
jgi:hypothetical protein